MHATGNYTITDLAEIFTVSRPTVYRTLQRRAGSTWNQAPSTNIDSPVSGTRT